MMHQEDTGRRSGAVVVKNKGVFRLAEMQSLQRFAAPQDALVGGDYKSHRVPHIEKKHGENQQHTVTHVTTAAVHVLVFKGEQRSGRHALSRLSRKHHLQTQTSTTLFSTSNQDGTARP